MNEAFEFYREHLHPLNPIPSFRHTAMWAMQSQTYVLSWQFSFSGQMNWSAAEANWLLIMDPTAASKYDAIESAVFKSLLTSVVLALGLGLGQMMSILASTS